MEPRHPTTPFGRRPLTLAHVAANANAKASVETKPIHKWQMFRDICAAKSRLNVSERSLAVLDALLSFHPETVLTGDGLIVFPSNRQLCLRAHGMAEATLRRHLAALAAAGLIVRRDSPNGKRYARKDRAGGIEKAFGFDLAPLVARAEEIAALAACVRAEELALRLVRERITICRRDIVKMIALGLETSEQGDWHRCHLAFRAIIERLPRKGARLELEALADELTLLAEEIENRLESLVNLKNMNANPDQSEQHKQNSNSQHLIESEHALRESRGVKIEATLAGHPAPPSAFPLTMVLQACPDIADYVKGGISHWRDLVVAAQLARSALGISPSAYEDAEEVLGRQTTAIVVSAILQKGDAVLNAGAYLRGLTIKGREGSFSPGPMLMALMRAKHRQGRRAS